MSKAFDQGREQAATWSRTGHPVSCAAGERLCGPHGAQDMAAGEDVAWDGDSEQRWQLAGEQVVNHDTVREQTGEDA